MNETSILAPAHSDFVCARSAGQREGDPGHPVGIAADSGRIASGDARRHPFVESAPATDGLVVLLAADGSPIGTAWKHVIHGVDTPLHLAFSCYVVRADGCVLLTRRSPAKRMWPETWTNACCGHPRPGEILTDAVRRHLQAELGLAPTAIALALPDFVYRAAMVNGLVEHEVCPVFVAEVNQEPTLDPQEADDALWLSWPDLVMRATTSPESLSPWSVDQISQLTLLADDPRSWLVRQLDDGAVDSPALNWPIRLTPSMASLDEKAGSDPLNVLGSRIDDVIGAFLDERHTELADVAPLATEVADSIRLLIDAGGKRLRPCFVVWGHSIVAGPDDATTWDDLAHAAAAVEMLHTFALLHDDVMDRSMVRRGSPSAHVQLSELHRRSGAVGDSEWFGSSAAILAGDMAFVWADQLLGRLRCDHDTLRRVRQSYDLLRSEVIAGQYLDLRLAGCSATSEQALAMALLKSGRYTVTRPLQIGAALAGAPAATIAALQRYGDAVGIAFQLRDDVLGVFGDPDITGKGVSDDLRDGKSSLLLVRALRLASPSDRKVLIGALGNPLLDNESAKRCREAVAASGAWASIEALIAAKVAEAELALEPLWTLDSATAVEALRRLAHILADRVA